MQISFTILYYTCCFLLLFICTGIGRLNQSNRIFDSKGIPAKRKSVIITLNLAGLLLIGVIPVLIFDQSKVSLIFGNAFPEIDWMIVYCLVLCIVLFIALKMSQRILIQYKKNEPPSLSFYLPYFFLRILFLCAYESFFRGTLLFTCIHFFGIIPAVIITTLLTVTLHVFTDKKEMLACIPFGLVLSLFCITAEAAWPAILIHLVLALTYEITPVYHLLTRLTPVK